MTPDYRFRTIEIARDALECLSLDTALTDEQRRMIYRAQTELTGLRFDLYPVKKQLTLFRTAEALDTP